MNLCISLELWALIKSQSNTNYLLSSEHYSRDASQTFLLDEDILMNMAFESLLINFSSALLYIVVGISSMDSSKSMHASTE